jgi:hypothetical protein
VLSFGALQTATLHQKDHVLVITEVAHWPFGSQWQWIDVPLWRYIITPGLPPAVSKSFVLQPPRLTSQQAASALDLYRRALSDNSFADRYEDIIGRALAAALAGDEEARSALREMYLAVSLDGHPAEVWRDAVETYQLYARTTGKVPLLPGV